MVSLESTTYPGTTDEELRPRIEARGFTVGEDFFLVYSPEREDPGNADFHHRARSPRSAAATTPACLEVGLALYGSVIDKVVPVSSTRAAELTKLLENIHRAVNIGLVNEMKIVADRMGIDIHEVIRAAATKPFGFVPYYPGPGLGGHCIPIDPFYLTWKAREYGVNTRFIELAGEVNAAMPDWVVGKAGRPRSTAGQGRSTAAGAGARHRLQEERRRHARVAFGGADGEAPRPRRRASPTATRTCRCSRKLRDHAHFDLSSIAN